MDSPTLTETDSVKHWATHLAIQTLMGFVTDLPKDSLMDFLMAKSKAKLRRLDSVKG